ncbi:MAG TPA: phosphatase PAP2 family protein [Rhizomicrobium sp.]|jgi:membrane-associated phospholipid phosphatase|nr:phosphatase PAP2 family protein [Rhizomicrobium sp.]
MLLWAGLILIVLGAACLPIDRRAAHYLYDHESAPLERFLENTTHWAKAAHWLVAALVALGGAQAALALWGEEADARRASNYALAFIACLAAGSAILHGMKLVVGRRRPRDDMEMGKYAFVWFKFRTDYNSFPSGHALTIVCVATIASCVAPQLALLWFAVAAWLGLTRALLTAHFLSDVFIGAGIGLLAARETLLYFFASLVPGWF